ncbi:MAG: DUF2849 domain-containing protein [Pseudomonadota bacterium]
MTTLKNPIAFTANRLLDGEAVWLSANGQWVETVEAAWAVHTLADREVAEGMAAKADADNHVVEPYSIDVAVNAGSVWPTKNREVIRAQGPTIRLDLGKQAQNQAQNQARAA